MPLRNSTLKGVKGGGGVESLNSSTVSFQVRVVKIGISFCSEEINQGMKCTFLLKMEFCFQIFYLIYKIRDSRLIFKITGHFFLNFHRQDQHIFYKYSRVRTYKNCT